MDIKSLYDAEPASPLYVAINKVLVRNDPNLMRMMKEASSKMCLATALTPGFRGFDLMRQRGTCPMGMRWAASSDMSTELSHIWIDQFTYWDSVEAHEDFHETFEDVVVDSCAKCGGMLLDGPEEPIFRVVKSDLPKLISKNQMMKLGFENQGNTRGYAMDSGETVTVMATHHIKPGKEAEFDVLKVVLTGEGSDELFGGYPAFRRDMFLHGLDHHHLVDGFFAGYRVCDLQQFEPVCTYSDV